MPDTFTESVAEDLRRNPVWSGDLEALGNMLPPVSAFDEPSVQRINDVAVVSVPRLLTASGWARVAELVDDAAANGVPVMLKISTVASQVAGAAECCGVVRALGKRVTIHGHVEKFAIGGGLVLLQTCARRCASPHAMLGLGTEGSPFVHQNN